MQKKKNLILKIQNKKRGGGIEPRSVKIFINKEPPTSSKGFFVIIIQSFQYLL